MQTRRSFIQTAIALLVVPFFGLSKCKKLDLSNLSPDEFWAILCDENHPQHEEAIKMLAKVLEKPLRMSKYD